MKTLIAILASVVVCSIFASTDDDSSLDNFLYDISNDPTEESNLYDDDSYEDIKSTFKERLDYWSGIVEDPDVPDWSDADSTYEELGGIGAWLTSDYEPMVVPHLYDYEYAPNIVFVLVDDWGWNDIGWRSTYLSWTTPTIDRLAEEGVRLNNHYTHELCVPTRGALMTGRYALRLGLWNHENEQSAVLRLNETTMAQELKSAGYRTYMVGKWDLGYAATQYYPTNRGFDSYYGYFTSQIDYWTKVTVSSSDIDGDDDSTDQYLDLHVNDMLVKDERELSSDYHSAALFEEKAEDAIKDWYENYSNQPFFLYYALQLMHTPFEAPTRFLERCASSDLDDGTDGTRYQTYCALNVMLDEVIANLTCTLEHFGMSESTILILASDNGGISYISGSNYPHRGSKGDYWRGGVSTTALIHSKLLPKDAWGLEYNGNVHITGMW
jgi:arylsulfatase A-like enzyme